LSHAARSLFAFGIFVTMVALAFIVAPASAVALLRLPPATDGWIRAVGLLALVIGAYDTVGGRAGLLPYIRASVYVRFGFASGVALLVASGQMPPSLLALGGIDVAGAVWTALALKRGAPAAAAAA
jgi:hypothetical protein